MALLFAPAHSALELMGCMANRISVQSLAARQAIRAQGESRHAYLSVLTLMQDGAGFSDVSVFFVDSTASSCPWISERVSDVGEINRSAGKKT
jgi:hypothetical protein